MTNADELRIERDKLREEIEIMHTRLAVWRERFEKIQARSDPARPDREEIAIDALDSIYRHTVAALGTEPRLSEADMEGEA